MEGWKSEKEETEKRQARDKNNDALFQDDTKQGERLPAGDQ